MKRRTYTPSAAQKAASEARKAAQKELFARLAKMNAVERANLAAQMPVYNPDGHMLSVGNMCLLAFQRADVTVVGGFRQWIAKGRCVRKGERGLTIRIPIGRGELMNPQTGDMETAADGSRAFFIGGTVFDVSQTEELETVSDRNDAITEHAGNLALA